MARIIFKKPVIYQLAKTTGTGRSNQQFVAGTFKLLPHNTVGFSLDHYDCSRPLVIDPALIYSTYLGGTNQETMSAIAVDSSGAAYLTGIGRLHNRRVTRSTERRRLQSARPRRPWIPM
jgi:hypothetical protein